MGTLEPPRALPPACPQQGQPTTSMTIGGGEGVGLLLEMWTVLVIGLDMWLGDWRLCCLALSRLRRKDGEPRVHPIICQTLRVTNIRMYILYIYIDIDAHTHTRVDVCVHRVYIYIYIYVYYPP